MQQAKNPVKWELAIIKFNQLFILKHFVAKLLK